ncbi:MAG: thioredoxin [Thermoplasmata archaeon]|nr:thioredoxin family protein [Thermoplasmata archaeon]NIS12970.1 thioredoxin family protein [Thermoplasmata archaeon]NIS20878.1 thioredoxin family protein [Thermoplasmata archaeon]NIT78298.1 thioredoxin family protein [Thermoplasmata archaeon]NIU49934.1 thioredoxin family protein [Thermoplasmata archaeon]
MVKEISAEDWERLVEGSDVPVMVEFVTSTCPVCATMEPAVERIAGNLGEQAKVYRVNVEREQTLAMRYGVQGVPTFMVFCKGNMVLSSQVGEVYPALLERMVTEAGEFGGQCAAKATKVSFEMTGYF